MNTYMELDLTVEYDYHPGCPASLEEPGDPEYCELTSVKVGNIEILPALTSEQCLELEAEALGHHKEFVLDEIRAERFYRRAA